MAVQTVFSDNLNPANGSLTSRFQNATAFYIDAPLLGVEVEIDVYLQVYFPTARGERVRNLRLGSLKDGEIKLNETDTETVTPIPNEFLDSGLEMALYFTPSEPIFLEVFVLGQEVTLATVDSRIEQALQRLDQLTTTNDTTTAILNLILNALNIPVPVIPTTAQQQFFFLQ